MSCHGDRYWLARFAALLWVRSRAEVLFSAHFLLRHVVPIEKCTLTMCREILWTKQMGKRAFFAMAEARLARNTFSKLMLLP